MHAHAASGTRISTSEVGAIIDDKLNASSVGYKRDIVIQRVGDRARRLPDNHRLADPLTYPLLFPRGDDGWGLQQIPLTRTTERKKFVTALQCLRHRLQIRDVGTPGGGNDYHLQHGRLTQEWILNSYVKIEGERLNFLQNNQKKIKADLYKEVQKAKEQNRCVTRVVMYICHTLFSHVHVFVIVK